MSRAGDRSDGPRAVIHRRILDVAAETPEASLEAIAEEVDGASVDLVDRVIEKYGDPGEEQPDGSTEESEATTSELTAAERDADVGESDPAAESAAETTTESGTSEGADAEAESGETEAGSEPTPERPKLSDDQSEALALVARNPEATQRELAAELDVTAATVSRWLNDIPGFDWSDREAFAARLLDGDGAPTADTEEPDDASVTDDDETDGDGPAGENDEAKAGGNDGGEAGGNGERDADGNDESGTGGNEASEIAALRRRVDALEARIEESRADGSGGIDAVDADGIDAELLHKVVQACMASDRITDEEEVRVLDRLLG